MSWQRIIEKIFSSGSSTEPKSEPTTESSIINSFDIIRLLRSASSAQAVLHSQLAQVEWAIEKNRLFQMLLTTLLGFACVLCLLIFGGVLVVVCSWETPYRIHAIVALMVIYALGLAFACYRFKTLSALSSQAFLATREELAADIALIKSKL